MLVLYILGLIVEPMLLLSTIINLPNMPFLPAVGLLFAQGEFFFLTLALTQEELDRLKIGTLVKTKKGTTSRWK